MSTILNIVKKGPLLAKDYLVGWRLWNKNKDLFSDLKCFCIFIGYPRSGHSLLGSIINAHRHAIISHELDVLRYAQYRFKREQLLGLILERDQRFGAIGRKWTGYSYEIPGQYQGRMEKLVVIGDKKGGSTTARLRSNPDLLDQFRSEIELPLRFIHVVRNPFDNIATIALRDDKGLQYSLLRFARDTTANSEIIARLERSSVLTIKHESLIESAGATIKQVCDFLSLDSPPDYLSDCSSIINEAPRLSRDRIPWTEQDRRFVNDCIARHSFLRSYSES